MRIFFIRIFGWLINYVGKRFFKGLGLKKKKIVIEGYENREEILVVK